MLVRPSQCSVLTLLAGWNILISPRMPPLARMLVFSSPSLRVVLTPHRSDDTTNRLATHQARV